MSLQCQLDFRIGVTLASSTLTVCLKQPGQRVTLLSEGAYVVLPKNSSSIQPRGVVESDVHVLSKRTYLRYESCESNQVVLPSIS